MDDSHINSERAGILDNRMALTWSVYNALVASIVRPRICDSSGTNEYRPIYETHCEVIHRRGFHSKSNCMVMVWLQAVVKPMLFWRYVVLDQKGKLELVMISRENNN